MFYSEKEAKNFLGKFGFNILDSLYVKTESELEKISKSLKFPVVVKVEGKKIIHKRRIGGVQLNIKNSAEVLNSFKKMQKIDGFEGVVIQPQISGEEIFLGIKVTPEFNHVVVFGSGGTNVEEKKDVSFRVAPFSKSDVVEMIHETQIGKNLGKTNVDCISKNIIRITKLIKKFPKISELDINPLMIKEGKAFVVDARMVI